MLAEKTLRLEHTLAFFGGNKKQGSPQLLDFRLQRLKLSHAFHAVGSPRSPQKLHNYWSAPAGFCQGKRARPVCCRQTELRGKASYLQGI